MMNLSRVGKELISLRIPKKFMPLNSFREATNIFDSEPWEELVSGVDITGIINGNNVKETGLSYGETKVFLEEKFLPNHQHYHGSVMGNHEMFKGLNNLKVIICMLFILILCYLKLMAEAIKALILQEIFY
jgi:hypothetical protein